MKLIDRISSGLERSLTSEEIEQAKQNPTKIEAPEFVSFEEREPNISGVYIDGEELIRVNTHYDFTIHGSHGLGYYLTRIETRIYNSNGIFRKKTLKKYNPD